MGRRVLGVVVLLGLLPSVARWEANARSETPVAQAQIEQWFREYMAALNSHNVDKVMSYYAPGMVRRRAGQQIPYVPADMRAIREWEAPMRARFDFEIVSVRGDVLTARLLETNAIYDALDVKRPLVSEYRWRDRKIVEMNLREIREAGRDWNEARGDFEKWLAAKPATETAGAMHEGRMLFTGEAAKKQLPLLVEYRKLTQAARAQNEKVMQSYIAALNRHDVDGQYAHYSRDLYFIDDGQKVKPEKEGSRANREFEAVNNAKWSYTVLGAGLDSLEMIITEAIDFYDLLGVGPRSHRARYRFRDGKIVQGQAWDWTQAGRPYSGARDRFTAWALKERPQQAARVTENGQLKFGKEAAAEINALVKEWYAAQPCRIYHPSFNASGTRIVFSSDCEGPWGIYVAMADGTLPRRVTPREMESRLPNWSPDGAKLVFQSNKEGNWEIYTVNVDGTRLQRMTEHARGDSSGAFSPDGAQILFASDRGGMNELYVMPAAGGKAKVVAGTRGAGFRNVWAPDGSHVLFRASTPPSEQVSDLGEFFRVRPDGTPLGAVGGGKKREYNAVYSPDGAKIAFDAHEDGMTWESGTHWDVWVMNADGSGRRNLTAKNGKNDWGPAWSPEGKRIVFLSGTNNIYDIWLMNADGTDVRRVTTWTGK